MAATTDQMRRSVDIGSLPFGMRQAFEQSLGEVGTAAPGARTAGAAASPDLGIPSNPLDPMMSGELPVENDPVTAGLSVGPGPGPVGGDMQGISDSSVERLRILAMNASSPVLRAQARRALRGTVREFRSG